MIGGRKTYLAAALTAAMTTGLALTGTASASVLYDTTWLANNNSYVGSAFSHIGAHSFNPNLIVDSQVADDFIVPNGPGYHITSVMGDFISNGTWVGEGVLVEFFQDIGGGPNATSGAQFFATIGNGLSVTSFNNHLGGSLSEGMRFTVDLSSAGIILGSGTWWMSIVAVHEATPSQLYAWVRGAWEEGNQLHRRNGGLAHGNGYGGIYGSNDWTLYSPAGDVSMKIEGTAIPGPGALVILSAWGLLRPRRRRS